MHTGRTLRRGGLPPLAVWVAGVLYLNSGYGAAAAQLPEVEPLMTIGCDFCEGPEQFSGIQALALDDRGRLFVADRSDPRIRVFGPDGESLRTFGRQGRGPGEVQYVLALQPTLVGLSTVDLRLGRVTHYDSLGEVVSTGRLNRFPSRADQESTTELLITFVDWRAGGATGVAWWDAHGDSLRVVVPTLSYPVDEQGEVLGHPAIAAAPDGGFVVGDGRREYRIRRYDPEGNVVGEYYRDIQREHRTDDEIAELEEALRRGPGGAPQGNPETGGDVTKVSPLRHHFGLSSLEFDDRGRLWVRTDRGSVNEALFDVFGSEGSYLGSISVRDRIGEFDIRGGRLAAVVYGEYDVEHVRIWQIVE